MNGKIIIIQPCSRAAGSFLLRSCSPLQVISSLSEIGLDQGCRLCFHWGYSQPPDKHPWFHLIASSTSILTLVILFYLPYSEFSLVRSCWLPLQPCCGRNASCSPKFICRNPSSQCPNVLGSGALGKKLSNECGAFMSLINALITKKYEAFLLSLFQNCEDTIGKLPSVKLQEDT